MRLSVLWLRRAVMRSRLQLRFRDLVLTSGRNNYVVVREDLARRYLSGSGIEIGPLTKPLRLPPGVRVQYVDRLNTDELLAVEGPLLRSVGDDPARVGAVDVVDDITRLAQFADESQDFVVANHVLEHIEDPVTAIENLVRVLRPGGILFLTLPDPPHTFDVARPRTTVEHVLRDHREGPEVSRRQHYEEWARTIECLPEERVPARVAEFEREDARHHFHVWALSDFLALLFALELPAELLHAQVYAPEFAVVLRKQH